MKAFNVYIGRKLIDVVFYNDKSRETRDSVYRSLVNHDGYDSSIRVTVARRRNPDCGVIIAREAVTA